MKRPFRPVRSALRVALAAWCLAGCTAGRQPVLSAADNDDVARITAYLNAMPSFEARFSQTGAFGAGAGLIWLDRPGHLRIDYEGPGSRVMVIANGRVRILDRATGALTTMPVSRTPLGLLLTPVISLSGAAHIDSLIHRDGQIRAVVTKTDQASQGRLTMDFADQPLRLEAVTVTDAYNRMLTMQLSGIDPAPRLTPGLFDPPVATPRS